MFRQAKTLLMELLAIQKQRKYKQHRGFQHLTDIQDLNIKIVNIILEDKYAERVEEQK